MDELQALLEKYERLFEEQLQRHETKFAERSSFLRCLQLWKLKLMVEVRDRCV